MCKKVISNFIPEKYYKSLSSQIIGFAKVTSLQVLTHLITEYTELEDDDIQLIDHKMKEPISGENIFEYFIRIEWNQEAVAVQSPYTPDQIVSTAYTNIDCQVWSQKPRLKKTWINFKAHFARVFK